MHGTHSQTRTLRQQRLSSPTRLHARIEALRRGLYLHGRDANSPFQILQQLYTLYRFTRYAPLNVPRSRLLDEALQADLIPPQRKTTTPPSRNNDHTIEKCKALQG